MAKGLRKGKVRAWNRFYDEYAEPVYRFALVRLDGDEEAAAEILQSVMVVAIELIRTFDAERGSLWSWLCGIAMNKIREGRREAVRAAKLEERVRDVSGYRGDGRSEVDNTCDVRDALSGLNPRHQEVLIRKYVDGQSVKDMSKAMGITEKAAESRLTRGREAFHREYSKLLKAKEADKDG